MDPTAAYSALHHALLNDASPGEVLGLLVVLEDWIAKGGFLPDQADGMTREEFSEALAKGRAITELQGALEAEADA